MIALLPITKSISDLPQVVKESDDILNERLRKQKERKEREEREEQEEREEREEQNSMLIFAIKDKFFIDNLGERMIKERLERERRKREASMSATEMMREDEYVRQWRDKL